MSKIDTDTKISYKEKMEEEYQKAEPIECIIETLKEINDIPNIDLYILTLAKSLKILKEKQEWLRKYVSFIKEENWIIINKENKEYSKENRDIVKAEKMKEKNDKYDKLILLDDDHKILKETQKFLKEKVNVFHISSILI